MSILIKKILDFILPPCCALCKTPIHTETIRQSFVCVACWRKLSFISKASCQKCAHPFPYTPLDNQDTCGLCDHFAFDSAFACMVYDAESKKLFTDFKHNDKVYLGNLLAKWMTAHHKPKGGDIMVPMPLHPFRLSKRGYNQSAILAKQLHNHFPDTKLLLQGGVRRIKNTPFQGKLSHKERQKNMTGAFVADPHVVANKHIILVDDVMTTGASLHYCAQSLKDAGAMSVHAWVCGRALRSGS